MFEAILSVCLMTAPEICRDMLLPGFESVELEACQSAVESSGIDWSSRYTGYVIKGTPSCQPAGKSADFEEIADGVFAHRGIVSDAAADNFGDISNIGFVIGAQSIAVIDSGGSRLVGEQVYRAIRQRSDLPISHLILTHMHPDHVFGASVFSDAGASVVGHAGLARALGDRANTYRDNFSALIGAQQFIGSDIVLPEVVVDTPMTIDLGSRELDLQTWPQSHTSNDLTVLDRASGVLFTGDLVFDDHAPALDGSVTGWQSVLDDLKAIPADVIMPGHGGPALAWPDGGTALERYLDILAEDTRRAIKNGDSLGEAVTTIAESEAPNWQLFDLFNPRNATVAYTELEWE